jgi:hypothetical protein
MEKKTLAGAIGAGAIAIGLGLAGGVALTEKDPVLVPYEVPVPFEVPVIEFVEVEREIPVEVIITETVMFEDEEFLKLICDRLMYDDLQECKAEVTAEDEALKEASSFLGNERKILRYLEDEWLIEDASEASLMRVYDSFEDVNIVYSDYEDNDYEFEIKVRIRDDGDRKDFLFIVRVDEGRVSILEAQEI